jgi:Uncharacterized ACR, COG1678
VQIRKGLFLGGASALCEKAGDGAIAADSVKWFCRYAGWAPQQLDGECARNVWYPVSCSTDLLTRAVEGDGRELWHEIMELVGGAPLRPAVLSVMFISVLLAQCTFQWHAAITPIPPAACLCPSRARHADSRATLSPSSFWPSPRVSQKKNTPLDVLLLAALQRFHLVSYLGQVWVRVQMTSGAFPSTSGQMPT